MTSNTRILVVANRTASTPVLLAEVTRRAEEGARFTLLIPPEKSAEEGGDWSREEAVRLLQRASGQEDVGHLDCGPDAFATVHRAVDDRDFDEIILCTPSEHLSRWVHHDLRHRLEHLGLPVCVIPPEPDTPLPDHVRAEMPDSWSSPPPSPGVMGTY